MEFEVEGLGQMLGWYESLIDPVALMVSTP